MGIYHKYLKVFEYVIVEGCDFSYPIVVGLLIIYSLKNLINMILYTVFEQGLSMGYIGHSQLIIIDS